MSSPWGPGWVWLPEGFDQAFPIALLSLVCWGTWGNTVKAAKAAGVPDAYYYWDYTVGVAVAALVFFAGAGAGNFAAPSTSSPNSTGAYHGLNLDDLDNGESFGPVGGDAWLRNGTPSAQNRTSLYAIDPYKIGSAIGAGAVFNIANLLLVVAIQIVGLSTAFPLGIGTALVGGTILTYAIDQTGKPEMLFPGVALALVAVVAMSVAHAKLDASKDNYLVNGIPASDKSALLGGGGSSGGMKGSVGSSGGSLDTYMAPVNSERSTCWKLTLCIVSGMLMACWSPLSAYSMATPLPKNDGSDAEMDALSTYGSFMFFSGSVLLTSPLLLVMQQYGVLIPLGGAPVGFRGFCSGSWTSRLWGKVGGFVWGVGTLANLVAGDQIGFALSYAVGQSAPLVAIAWGVLYYKEFEGCPSASVWYLLLSVTFYIGAIVIIAFSGDNN